MEEERQKGRRRSTSENEALSPSSNSSSESSCLPFSLCPLAFPAPLPLPLPRLGALPAPPIESMLSALLMQVCATAVSLSLAPSADALTKPLQDIRRTEGFAGMRIQTGGESDRDGTGEESGDPSR